MSTTALLAQMCTDELSNRIQSVIEAERQEEIAFRRSLVEEFNQPLSNAGHQPDVAMLERQIQFVSLSMPADEVHRFAAEYAACLGKPLPPPPPSLSLEDI